MSMINLTDALTEENPAAQDNVIINLLATACHTEGWAVFVHHDGEAMNVLAGELNDELRAKIVAALNEALTPQSKLNRNATV